MFSISGTTTIPGGVRREAAVSWSDDGTIGGDPHLVDEADRRIALGEWVKATPSGPSAVAAATPAEAAAILLVSMFQSAETTGDFPPILDVDEGAIP